MSKNKVIITYELREDGSLRRVEKEASKASKATDNLTNSTDKTNKSQDNYNRKSKGAAQATSNSTKAFSKMQQGMEGGLVPAYATLAANVFAVTAAFSVLQKAAAAQQLESGLMAVGRSGGQNLRIVSNALKEVTGAAVSVQEAMEATALATSAGFSQQQIISLGEVAKGTSLALGRDMTDALTRLVRGTSKLEPELLDELGIFVKLGKATGDYADALGVSVDSLTEFERRQAFVNAAITEGQQKFGIMNDFVDANPYNKLSATFQELSRSILNTVNVVLIPFVSFLGSSVTALGGIFAIFASGIISKIIPAIGETVQVQKAAAQKFAAIAAKTSDVVSDKYTKAASNVSKAWKTVPKGVQELEPAFKKGTVSAAQYRKAINSLSSSERIRQKRLDAGADVNVADKEREIRQIQRLKREIQALQAAESKRFTSSKQGAAALAAARSTNLQARGLNEVANAGPIVGVGKALKYATLQLSLFSAKQGVWGNMTQGVRVLTGGVRLLGTAFLNAIPLIGQVIFAFSLLKLGYDKFFAKPPSALTDELKKAEERYAEFPKIVDQLVSSYERLNDRALKYNTILKGTGGLFSQTKDQIQAFADAEMQRAIQTRTDAINLRKEQERKVRALGGEAAILAKIASIESGVADFRNSGDGRSAATAGMTLPALKADLANYKEAAAAAKALAEEPVGISDERVAATSTAISKLTATLEILESKTKVGSSEQERLAESLALLNSLGPTTADNLQKQVALITALNTKYQANNAAINAAVDINSKFSTMMVARRKNTQMFVEDLEKVTAAQGAINSSPDVEGQENFMEILQQYGELGSAYKKLTEESTRSDKEYNKKLLTNSILRLDAFKKELVALGQLNEERAVRVAAAENEMSAATMFGFSQKALAIKKEELVLDKELFTRNLKAAKRTEDKQKIEAATLALLKNQTDQLKLQFDLINANSDVAGKLFGFGAGSTQFAAESATRVIGTMDSTTTTFDEAGTPTTTPDFSTPEKIQTVRTALAPMMNDLRELGPEGELLFAIGDGLANVGQAVTTALSSLEEGSTSTDKAVAGLQIIGSAIGTIASIQKAKADAQVANIDREIAAEKRRDGQSASSLAKIQAMESKKEKIKKKAFEADKKMKMAQVVTSTAAAIMQTYATGGYLATPLAIMMGVIGAAQLAAIASTSYDGGGAGGAASGPSSISVGQRQNVVDFSKANSPSGEIAYARGEQGSGTGMSNFTPSGRASGGNTAFMVGEQGPEMFVPERPGTILPADDAAKAVRQDVNVNFNISAMDSKGVEEVLQNQRGQIIGMIREAANAHGEMFLESVTN